MRRIGWLGGNQDVGHNIVGEDTKPRGNHKGDYKYMLEVITRIPRVFLKLSSNYPCTHVEFHIDLRLG